MGGCPGGRGPLAVGGREGRGRGVARARQSGLRTPASAAAAARAPRPGLLLPAAAAPAGSQALEHLRGWRGARVGVRPTALAGLTGGCGTAGGAPTRSAAHPPPPHPTASNLRFFSAASSALRASSSRSPSSRRSIAALAPWNALRGAEAAAPCDERGGARTHIAPRLCRRWERARAHSAGAGRREPACPPGHVEHRQAGGGGDHSPRDGADRRTAAVAAAAALCRCRRRLLRRWVCRRRRRCYQQGRAGRDCGGVEGGRGRGRARMPLRAWVPRRCAARRARHPRRRASGCAHARWTGARAGH